MKGPSIAVIMGGKKPPPDAGSEPGLDDDEEGSEDHATAAMEEFIAAVHAQDAGKALEAFDVLCDLHGGYEEGEEEEEK